jgi:ribonuclease BN (tRNA processing enzyme)
MKLTILGSGTGVPSAVRGGPGCLVQAEGFDLVMDLGMGTLSKLNRLQVSLKQFGPILISHLHPDHTAELVSLLFALKNLGIGRNETLQIIGCRGLKDFIEKLQEVYGDWIRPATFELEIHEMVKNKISLEKLRISSIPVEHAGHSNGYRLEDSSGKALAYSGDSDFCSGLVDLIQDADLALLECSFPDQKKCPGHLTPSEAGRAAQEAGAKKVVLTHFYPECDGVDLIAQCRKYYKGEVWTAQDLMELHI